MRAGPLLLLLMPAALAAQTPASWRLVPEVTYGATDGSAAELSDLRDFEVARNGNVLAVDTKGRSLRLFGPTGIFLKTVGRGGQGPGEYANPNGIAIAPDGTFWINDPSNNRLTQLREDGTLLGTTPVQIRSWTYVWDGFFDRRGRLVTRVMVAPKNGNGVRYLTSRLTFPAQKGDSVPVRGCTPAAMQKPGNEPYYNFRSKDGKGGGSMMAPFAPMEVQTQHPAGYVWCAFGSDYTIYRIDLARGDTLGIARGSTPAIPVSKAERDSAEAEVKKFAAQYGEMSPDLSRIPNVRPRIAALYADDRDRLWVQLTPFGAKETRFDVLNLSGQRVATVALPGRLRMWLPMVFRGDRLYAALEDDDGVPTIVRYRIDGAR